MKNKVGIQGARRLLLLQLSLTTLAALLALLFISINAALSALLGGLICVLPNAYFARKLFQYQGARAARKIVKSFYQGEALKILLSIALFALVFCFVKIIPWILFTTYIGVQMTIWFAPLFFANKGHRPETK